MAGRDCIKRLVEKSGGAINQDAAKEILDTVDREARRRVGDGFDYDDAVSQVIAERMENTKVNLAKQKANMAKNLVLKARNTDKISQLVDAGIDIRDAFRADLEGINSPVEGTRTSLDTQGMAVEHSYFSRFLGELNREGLLPVLNSKKLSDEIGRELYALSYKESGATTNKQAKKIADIIYKTREGQRQRLNKAGADISEVGGYIMPQRHDTFEMVRVKEDKWVEDMLPLVDEKRTFGGDYEDLEDALRSAYRAMVTGVRLNDPVVQNAKLFQFSGPANLAKRVSQAREIHFKDYDSWKKWNDTYGMRDLNEGIIDAIRYDARNIALIERYGTNPEAMLREVADEVKKKYRDKAAKEGVQNITNKLDSLIDGAMQKNQIPGSPTLARVGSNIRVFQNITKLGGAVISSITDIPMKSLEYQFQGKSWLSSTVQPFLDIGQGFKTKKERAEWASLTGVGFESMISDIGGRFSAQDDFGRKASKVQRMFFKLNGLAWWTDSHKNAMGRVMSHHLGQRRNTAFAKLDDDTKRLFGNYNISEADWDAMRAAAVKMDDGRHYIFPDNIEKPALREKLTGYFVDRAEAGVITPSAREQRLMTLGTQKGTVVGEAVRLMAQFKSFPTTVITKVWGRALYGKGKADIPAVAYLMLNTMMFGYMATTMKDLLKGRTPKDPTKIETVYASLVQGGGAGILADVLLQDAGFGRSFSQTVVGPSFGTIDDLFKIYSAGIRGEGSASQAFRTAVGFVPFNNLFYARAALDQIILLQMQEQLNPGYLRRMERNLKRTYGQELIYK